VTSSHAAATPQAANAPSRVRAYVGLGSNLGEPATQIRRALRALEEIPRTRLAQHAGLYRSPALGPPQPDYVNSVAALETALTPHDLLAALQAIERAQGRERDALRWGPRTLDLDLLLYGAQRIESADLSVPHPHLHERAFVLLPLCEIAPRLEVPGHGPLSMLVGGLSGAELVRVDG